MKSSERAEQALKNPINRSSSKYQYSFGKEQRFKQRILKTEILDKFYDLPSQATKRGAVFGTDKRECDREHNVLSVPSWNYNPKEAKSTGQIVFAPGRDACKVASVFYSTTIAYPGPGKYNPERPKSKSHIIMAGRPKATYSTISPGPKYNFESTLLDRNKILSQEKRKGSCRIVLPTSKSRLATSPSNPPSSPSHSRPCLNASVTEGMITHKGSRVLGQSGSHAIMSRQERFRSEEKVGPGPGQYAVFSEFIEPKKP